MTKFEMLSVFWNTRVAFIEFLGSLLLIFFFLTSKHIVHQLKSNIFVSSFLYTLSFFSALFIAQATSGFLSNSDIKPFLIPQIVIFESIIKGLTNSFTGTLLYQGYFYIFGSQILGVIFGYLAFFLYTKMVKNITKYKEDFHKIVMVEKAPKIGAYLQKEIFFGSLFVFILMSVPRIPFSANLTLFDHQIVLFILLLFFFIINTNTGFINFNLWSTLVIIPYLAIRKVNNFNIRLYLWQIIINVLTTILIPAILSLIFLGIASSSNLSFNL
ncbi:MAG4940 family membrane protein [Mesomycoplasma ovipneumoniae]|uniref:MAG4940 family membrane protein n=1 Tax=Mesomycoplasma ovipneumoniae TaxID=29562 RepID=UPI002964F39B|nr:hypothetical protein [Mesomycoplasma ovipneumoniae]MDW2923638.1 hypothetical protein [Mesomycoplasma ovipneumoniae]